MPGFKQRCKLSLLEATFKIIQDECYLHNARLLDKRVKAGVHKKSDWICSRNEQDSLWQRPQMSS